MFQPGGNASGAAKDWVIYLKRGIPLILRIKELVLIDDSPHPLTSTTEQVFSLTPGEPPFLVVPSACPPEEVGDH